MLHINNPQYADERKDSKPLSLEEQNDLVGLLKFYFEDYEKLRKSDKLPPLDSDAYTFIQSMLYHYENLQALSDFIGGWEGAHELVKDKD